MTHPHIALDVASIEEIAAALDLRAPNKAAITKVAERFDSTHDESFEVVLDLATGVGKTYIAAGLIDYLAAAGVRHFLVITPGRTIQAKTIANFTPGSPKSLLGGMTHKPVVITAEDFASGSVRAALDDADTVKLFVFNVQQLITPSAKGSRRTRKFQEWLGRGLYDHLRALDDLVVLSDEHHVYQENAKAFSAAVRDLDAMAVIGLTATPDKNQEAFVIYRYELAQAIADQLVKTPVLVGRRDDRKDVETRLRDGLALLDVKRDAVNAWCAATGKPKVNPVMFVVCDNIDSANAVSDTLRRLLDDYDQAVLTIHSDAPDDALARLDAVENEDSPVRVIVSVSMLKEGWDVKNIFVICSLRPSIKDALTEQTLGRGLRLPWGEYTGVEILDTVEVLSHERYEQLLEQAGVLIEGLVAQRTHIRPVQIARPPGGPPAVVPTQSGAGETTSQTARDDALSQPPVRPEVTVAEDSDLDGASAPFFVVPIEERTVVGAVEAEALALVSKPVANRSLMLPKVTRTPLPRHFTLSVIPDGEFEAIGRQLAAVPGDTLRRKRLTVVDDPAAPTGRRLVPVDAEDVVIATKPNLPLQSATASLTEALLSSGLVAQDAENLNAAKRLVAALVKGAGGERAAEHLAWFLDTAADLALATVRSHYRSVKAEYDTTVTMETFAPMRPGRPIDPNRHGAFSRAVAYADWNKSLMNVEWFDSKTERSLANILDGSDEVALWVRLHRGDWPIVYEGGTYHPDFYVQLLNGTHVLLEVKADRDLNAADVIAKQHAADHLARLLTDRGGMGMWRYGLVGESPVNNAHGTWSVLVARAKLEL